MKASKLSFIDRLENFNQNKWILWGTWAIYTILVIALCSIHEPCGDEYHVWSMVYRLSFPELIEAMRGEGHFCLWHLCVWPWVRFCDMDYHAIFVASTILMSLAVWLLLFKLEFSFVGKLLIIFSSPFIYHFPVISRCYALIPPIVVALAIVYQEKKNPFLYCFLIGLLAHTHAYMEGMVAVLWCLFVYYQVFIPYKQGNINLAKKSMYASLITIFMVLLAFVQIAGGIIDAKHGTSVAMNQVSHPTDWLLYVYENHRIKLTTSLNQYLGNWIPKIDLPITLTCYCVIVVSMFALLQKTNEKKNCLWIICVSIFWQIIFAINIYSMWFQRVYLLYIPVLFVLWAWYNKNNRKYVLWVVACFWMLNTTSDYRILKDITHEYCFDARLAKQIEEELPDSVVVYTDDWIKTCKLLKHPISHAYDAEHLSRVFMNTDDKVLYYLTTIKLDTLNIDNANISLLWSGEEGNHEFTGNGYCREISLYQIKRNETSLK